MKNKKGNIPLCVMCFKELGRVDIKKIVAICLNPACPNFSLLCLPEDTILRFQVKELALAVDKAWKKTKKYKKTAHRKKIEKILKQ